MYKIIIGSDHAGFLLKEKLIAFLIDLGYEVTDMGPSSFDGEDDYPLLLKPVAEAVGKNPEDARGIIIGGSGQGEAVVANRVPHVRAGVYYAENEEMIKVMREHNDTNVLALGARFLSEAQAKDAVKLWLGIPFPREERHVRRIGQID